MAQSQPTSSDDYVQEQHQKDVIVTAYGARAEAFDDAREFAHDVFGDVVDVDLMETYINETEVVDMTIVGKGQFENWNDELEETEFEASVDIPYGSEREALANFFGAMPEDERPDWLEFEERIERSEEYSNSVRSATKEFVRENFGEISLEMFGFGEPDGFQAYPYQRERQIDDKSVDADPEDTITQYARIEAPRKRTIEPQRKLVHQDERSQHQKFEGSEDDEFWAIPFTVHVEATSSQELDEISELLVPPVYAELATLDAIESVRLSECEQQMTQVGACYNL